jgi:hypothetical protein
MCVENLPIGGLERKVQASACCCLNALTADGNSLLLIYQEFENLPDSQI